MNVTGVGGPASLPVPLPGQAHGTTSAAAATAVAGTGSAGGAPGAGGTPGTGGSTGASGAVTGSGTASAATGTSAVTGPGGTDSTSLPGELPLPGQHAGKDSSAVTAKRKEVPKPEPLPPLKGLTVAEIRAMLGVANPAASVDGARQQPASTTLKAVVSRYA